MKRARFALLAALVVVGVLVVSGVALAATIKGTPKADKLYGTEQADNINPFNGDDYVDAKGGDDYVHHSYGNDTIDARDGEVDLVDCAYLTQRGDGADTKAYDTAYADYQNTVVDCKDVYRT